MVWWFETVIAFARLCLWGVETAVAFAGEKWAFLVQFSDAEVMPVSMVPSWGRAEASSVSTLRCFYVLCAKFVALLGLAWVRARKSSPCARKMAQNQRFVACRANFFAEQPRNGACWASSVAPPLRYARCWAAVISDRTGNRLTETTTSGWA